MPSVSAPLERALTARQSLFDPAHVAALRLFNGFTEGCSDLVIDVYGATVVIYDYAAVNGEAALLVQTAVEILMGQLPWLRAGVLKTRNAASPAEKRGRLIFGSTPDGKIQEQGIWYAVDLMLNRDASFYLDTRNLRTWILKNLRGRTVLNAFAYTGSLGVAAMAAGAERVMQLDRNRKFLNVAKSSYKLNALPVRAADFIQADFFRQAAKFRRKAERFDCVLIDPPFFASSPNGTVDQVHDSARLINKVRPLVNDGGKLVAVNNSLYVSGREYLQTLDTLCADGYLRLSELIPVPDDFIGYAQSLPSAAITDPAPFNHSTKIAILEARREEP